MSLRDKILALSDDEIDALAKQHRVSTPLDKNPPTPVNQPPGKLIGTSGGKKVYELPGGGHVMEQ